MSAAAREPRRWSVAPRRLVAGVLPHPLYRAYRRRRVARQIAGYEPRIVNHDYGGVRLSVHLADPLAEGWYDHDWPRLREVDELARAGVLVPGATVFDLGAHQAIVALILAAEIGPSGRVVAVEAEPHNAVVARRNVALNGVNNVTVRHAAISSEPGRLHFAESLNGRVDARTRVGNVEVPAMTIDQLAAEYGDPDLVFLDVEGYEGKALSGAARTLSSGRTSFFVEIHGEELVDCSVAEVIERFSGYRLRHAFAGQAGEAGAFVALEEPPPPVRSFLLALPVPR